MIEHQVESRCSQNGWIKVNSIFACWSAGVWKRVTCVTVNLQIHPRSICKLLLTFQQQSNAKKAMLTLKWTARFARFGWLN